MIEIEKWNSSNPENINRKYPKSRRIVKWKVTKDSKTVHVITIDEGGREGEYWIYNGNLIIKSYDSGDFRPLLADEAREAEQMIFASNAFPYTNWINIENFVSNIKKQGKEVSEFIVNSDKKNNVVKNESSTYISEFNDKAWVDIDSRMPLFIEKEGDFYSYLHLGAFSGKLIIPDAAIAALKREESRLKALNTAPPPP